MATYTLAADSVTGIKLVSPAPTDDDTVKSFVGTNIATINGHLKNVLAGSVTLLHSDGTVDYFMPTADTDLARGVALTNAVAACVSGDVVELRPGTYELAAEIAIPYTLTIRGYGRGQTIIKRTTGYAFSASDVHMVWFHDMRINGAIHLQGSVCSGLENVDMDGGQWAYGTTGTGEDTNKITLGAGHGITTANKVRTVWGRLYRNYLTVTAYDETTITVNATSGGGTTWPDGGTSVRVDAYRIPNLILAEKNAARTVAPWKLTLRGCNFYSAGDDGVVIKDSLVMYNIISDCVFQDCGGDGLNIDYGTGIALPSAYTYGPWSFSVPGSSITNCIFNQNGRYWAENLSESPAYYRGGMRMYSQHDSQISNCRADSNGAYGFLIRGLIDTPLCNLATQYNCNTASPTYSGGLILSIINSATADAIWQNAQVTGCLFEDEKYNIQIVPEGDYLAYINITGCSMVEGYAAIRADALTEKHHIKITGNDIFQSATFGILLKATTLLTIPGIEISGNKFTALTGSSPHAGVYTYKIKGATVKDNYFVNCKVGCFVDSGGQTYWYRNSWTSTIAGALEIAADSGTVYGLKGSGIADEGTETIVTNPLILATSVISLQSTSAAFSALDPYISAKAAGSFTVTTTTAAGMETFDYTIEN